MSQAVIASDIETKDNISKENRIILLCLFVLFLGLMLTSTVGMAPKLVPIFILAIPLGWLAARNAVRNPNWKSFTLIAVGLICVFVAARLIGHGLAIYPYGAYKVALIFEGIMYTTELGLLKEKAKPCEL